MANINLPKSFSSKLEDNQHLAGLIYTSISQFGDILHQKKLFFFEDYTDHGIDHIEQVLAACNNLMTTTTLKHIVNENDITYLILSVVLHDIAMHIELNGFNYLLSGAFDDIFNEDLDKYKWKDLWEDYINEMKRLSGKQIKAIFGDESILITIPELSNPLELRKYDRMFIGEFIRRHHARLAHEIALKGFPGNGTCITFPEDIGDKERKLIGFIARSHGMNIRYCADKLRLYYPKNYRQPLGIHAVYLMILLRLADYIQIESNRTSGTIFKTRSFASPVSKLEHELHLSVNNIDFQYQDDPERIYVSASPTNSILYLKLKKLIEDIQTEFDISWAVLGEFYGRVDPKPEVRFRRIISEITDPEFIDSQKYVAESIKLEVNNELIKLLVSPLYGNDPGFGVRELLQNAIDACQEKRVKNAEFSGNIKIEVIKDEKFDTSYFVITDDGIGMDINIIKNYFLSIGASFRKSQEWQKEFLNSNGGSMVRRSGRFGIGILAAFLLGENMYVETKKDGIGYKFNVNINSDQINITKDLLIKNGTKIIVELNPRVFHILTQMPHKGVPEWTKWYTFNYPIIRYIICNKEVIPYNLFRPDENEISYKWNDFSCSGYEKVSWTYDAEFAPFDCSCNGIIIPNSFINNSAMRGIDFNIPAISIIDKNEQTPLTLDRKNFSDNLPFIDNLNQEIIKDIIAFLLNVPIKTKVENTSFKVHTSLLGHPALSRPVEKEPSLLNSSYAGSTYGSLLYEKAKLHKYLLNELLFSKNGFILNYPFFINKIGKIETLLFHCSELAKGKIWNLDIKELFIKFTFKSKIKGINIERALIPNYIKDMNDYQVEFWVNDKIQHLQLSQKIRQYFHNSASSEGWKSWKNHNNANVIDPLFFENIETQESFHWIRRYQIFCEETAIDKYKDLFEEYLGENPIIPYDILERKKKFPKAFKELAVFMEKYENQKYLIKK